MAAPEQVLAFDFGLKHIGVAVGQTLTGTATPLTTLSARDGKPNWPAVRELVQEWRPSQLVVGLPLNMDDSESKMSKRARRFAAALEAETKLPVALADERLTSYASRAQRRERADRQREDRHREGRERGRRGSGRKGSSRADPGEHGAAAALIAESWLNAGS